MRPPKKRPLRSTTAERKREVWRWIIYSQYKLYKTNTLCLVRFSVVIFFSFFSNLPSTCFLLNRPRTDYISVAMETLSCHYEYMYLKWQAKFRVAVTVSSSLNKTSYPPPPPAQGNYFINLTHIDRMFHNSIYRYDSQLPYNIQIFG